MAVLALLEDIANGCIKKNGCSVTILIFLAYGDDWLISRFRFPGAILLELCIELGPGLERD